MGLSSWLGDHLRPWRSVAELLARLVDPDAGTREDASNSLWGRAGRLDPTERQEVEAALRHAAATDESGLVRANAVAGLVALDAAGAVDLGLPVLHDTDWAARSIAASQLARVEDPRVVDALIPLLHDDEGWVREAAAGGLGQQGDPRALEPLRELIRRERKDLVVKKTAKRAVSDLERAASG
jgi:HEAT repeat protein